MKSAIGKIGIGLAGAVAAVGLIYGGVQNVQAQLVLVPAGSIQYPGNANPSVSYAGVVNGQKEDTWTYCLALENPTGASSNVLLTGSNTGGYTQGTFTIGGFTGYDSAAQSGLAAFGTGGAGGQSWSITSSTPSALTLLYTGTNISVTAGNTIYLGEFQFNSTNGPSAVGTYSSNVTQTTNGSPTNTDPVGALSVQVPNLSVVAAPLPLPAAFWPGLMTLGSVAVIGGLRLRRRTV